MHTVGAALISTLGQLCANPIDVTGDGDPDLRVAVWIQADDDIQDPQRPLIRVAKVVNETFTGFTLSQPEVKQPGPDR